MSTLVVNNTFKISHIENKDNVGVPHSPGLPTVNKGFRGVELSNEFMVGLGQGYQFPDLNGNVLVRAQTSQRGRSLLKADASVKSVIIMISCKDLLFGFDPLAEDLNLWPGGDGDIEPFAQGGGHNTDNKKQIFQIPVGKHMYVTDKRAAVATASNVDGRLVFTRTVIGELANAMARCAVAQRKPQAKGWALHNLYRLPDKGVEGVRVRAAIETVKSLRYGNH